MSDSTKIATQLIDDYMDLMGKIKNKEQLTPQEMNAFVQRSLLTTVGSLHEMTVKIQDTISKMIASDTESQNDRKAIHVRLDNHETRLQHVEKVDRFRYVALFTFATVLCVVLSVGFMSGAFKLNADVDVAQTVQAVKG